MQSLINYVQNLGLTGEHLQVFILIISLIFVSFGLALVGWIFGKR